MNSKQAKCARSVAIGAAAVMLGACASIIHSQHQDVSVASTPTGASVQVDGTDQGKTPMVAKLKRKATHVVTISMPGYRPFELTMNRKVSGWVWGNLVFGGLIGLAVDGIGGGMYRLEPEQVNAALVTNQAMVTGSGDGLYVMAVLRPDPSWQKIAQLERADSTR